jgi:hypothetical protein
MNLSSKDNKKYLFCQGGHTVCSLCVSGQGEKENCLICMKPYVKEKNIVNEKIYELVAWN